MMATTGSAPNLPTLPDDVIEWCRERFDEANRSVTENLINNPNARETTLDDTLLAPLQRRQAPIAFPSGVVVQLDVHNIGGLRRWGGWEVADIAVLVTVARGGVVQAQKIGVLQSKRLYPKNNDVRDEDPVGFGYGLNSLLRPDPFSALRLMASTYAFDDECHYGALVAGDRQAGVIQDFNGQFGEAAFYLLYNPPSVPDEVRYPLTGFRTLSDPPPLGARVVRVADMSAVLSSLPDGRAPRLLDVQAKANPHARLEEWVVDLLRCRVGIAFDRSGDELVERLLVRRSGPIGAVIAISVALPDDD